MDLTKHMRFTDAPRNQLGDLGTEVEDENFLMHSIAPEDG
jgi:hypothetical protein